MSSLRRESTDSQIVYTLTKVAVNSRQGKHSSTIYTAGNKEIRVVVIRLR